MAPLLMLGFGFTSRVALRDGPVIDVGFRVYLSCGVARWPPYSAGRTSGTVAGCASSYDRPVSGLVSQRSEHRREA